MDRLELPLCNIIVLFLPFTSPWSKHFCKFKGPILEIEDKINHKWKSDQIDFLFDQTMPEGKKIVVI